MGFCRMRRRRSVLSALSLWTGIWCVSRGIILTCPWHIALRRRRSILFTHLRHRWPLRLWPSGVRSSWNISYQSWRVNLLRSLHVSLRTGSLLFVKWWRIQLWNVRTLCFMLKCVSFPYPLCIKLLFICTVVSLCWEHGRDGSLSLKFLWEDFRLIGIFFCWLWLLMLGFYRLFVLCKDHFL